MTSISRVLRIGLALCFAGHGALALLVNPAWFAFYAVFGLSDAVARSTMPLVGALDLVIAVALVARPHRLLFAWCLFWTVFTAILRPLSGTDVSELLIRAINFGPALALLILGRSLVALRLVLGAAITLAAIGAALGGALLPPDPTNALAWIERAGAPALVIALALAFAPTQRP